MSGAEEHAWLHAHVTLLRERIDKLTRIEQAPGKGGAAQAKDASDRAERYERRVSRLLRAAAHLDGQAEKKAAKARRLAKSKSPKDRAELVIGAASELPVDLALQVGEVILKQARERAGGGER
jgi:hypothetical protein